MTDDAADDADATLDADLAHRWVAEFVTSFRREAERLGDLDRQAGDGDFGTNLTSALGKAEHFVERLAPQTAGEVFDAVSKGFLDTGGTSGPLFGMWFRELGKAARDVSEVGVGVGVARLAAGVAAGLAVIQRLGGASVGDSTMVDALAPAAAALAAARDRGDPLGTTLDAAATAAAAGAESTRDLLASRGRASYVGEVARGVLDPGAVTVALFFAAGATAVRTS